MRRTIVGALGLVAIVAAACGGTASQDEGDVDRGQGDKGKLVVADTGFTETQVMAEMYASVLADAGYQTSTISLKSTELVQPQLEKGDVAVMPAYVATYADVLQLKVNGDDAPAVSSPDLNESYEALKKLAEPLGITPLEPSKAVDQNAFAVNRELADQHNLKTLSDLAKLDMPLKLAAGSDCKTRPFCQPGLEQTYGLTIEKVDPLGVDSIQTKQSVQQGDNDLALVLTTDATVEDYGLVVLEDDKNLQNADNLVPVVNSDKLDPEIEETLNTLSATLTTEDLAQMNKEVDVEQKRPVEVAEAYLKDKGLIKAP